MAALMGGCSLQGMAQQITPKDVAGDKEYNRVCREYELKGGDSMELLQAYLDKYPNSIHKQEAVTDCLCLFYGGKIQGGHCPVPVV